MLWLRVENEHLAAIAEGKPLVEVLSDRFYKCRLLGEWFSVPDAHAAA